METPNAIKVCNDIGGYIHCEKCPIYPECSARYETTEEFEKAIENAAIVCLATKSPIKEKVKAKYFETFGGNDYFRDEYGNIYTKTGNEVAYCSNLKHGSLTEDKAEPSYPIEDVELIY